MKGFQAWLAILLALKLVLSLVGTVEAHAKEPWRSEFWSLSEYSDDPYRLRTETYRVDIADLHPGQFAVGMSEVRERRAKIEEMDKEELRKYLKKKVGSVVIGPGEEFWLVDGHHLARAVQLAGHEEILVKVMHDWSGLSREEFFRRMKAKEYLWLYDENGKGPKDPSLLPSKINALKDDVYRGLAWRVQKAGGYRESAVPFAEFLWAQFFRPRIPRELVVRHRSKALEMALELAKSDEAKGLPGYKKSSRRCESLLKPAA